MPMQSPPLTPMAVIGAGSWGTALAIQCARAGHPTRLWGRDAALVESMRRVRRNARYLPDAPFPGGLEAVADLGEALEGARDVLIAVPSSAFRSTLELLKPRLDAGARIAWASKGFETSTGLLPHQVAGEVLGDTAGRRALRPDLCARSRSRATHRHDHRLARRALCRGAGGAAVGTAFSRLHAIGHRRRGGRRRGEERDRHRRGHRRRHGLRRQYARGADHPRARRDDALGAEARRATRDLHGSRGARRSRAHLHRRSIPQSAARAWHSAAEAISPKHSAASVKWWKA